MRTESENAPSTQSTAVPSKRLRGAYVNTAAAQCSIYESGRMVYRNICDSPFYDLEYFSLDSMDIELFSREGKLQRTDGQGPESGQEPVEYDFYVFNWHFITMASTLSPESIARLPRPKFTVVLELAPNDPLQLVPPGVFDGHIALDPSADPTHSIFPFPRPLDGDPWVGRLERNEIPVIGSFGFGTPGKGFELLVEAVNREFDQAVVRVNIPSGTYVFTDSFHKQDYPRYIESVCKKIAKPGVEVRFSYDFLTPDGLVAWCAENDLNCFMYTRAQPGLAATTDQAVTSGRPLATISNDTFRHIHRYIPPYPVMGLRQALATTTPQVQRLQQDWSREAFSNRFHQMLVAFGLGGADGVAAPPRHVVSSRTERLLILAPAAAKLVDATAYAKRLADSLGRSGNREILLLPYGDVSALQEAIASFSPTGAILVDAGPGEVNDWTAVLDSLAGPKIIVAADPRAAQLVFAAANDSVVILPRQPIIPFFTAAAPRRDPPSIWLVGFAARGSNLEDIVTKISESLPEAEIVLEARDAEIEAFRTRISALDFLKAGKPNLTFSVTSLPIVAGTIVDSFASSSLVVFFNDPSRTNELEDLSCLAMATDRPVVFTRAGVFPRYLGRGTYVEDLPVHDLMALGIAAHIKVYYDFGEWQFAAGITRILDGSWQRPASAGSAPLALTSTQFLQIACQATGVVVPEPESEPVVPVTADPGLAAPAATPVIRSSGPAVFLLVGVADGGVARPSRFVTRLARTWQQRGQPVHLVVWDLATKRLQLPTHQQWAQLGAANGSGLHAARFTGPGQPPVLVDPASCSAGDWLVVPEPFHDKPGRYPLLTMDMILEGRRVGLKSAFIFHGAEPLFSNGYAGRFAQQHELHMQALLLADLILPGSDVAATDLNAFFVQYQLADVVPLTKKVVLPATDDGHGADPWETYVRTVSGVLADAADPARHLTSLYVWHDRLTERDAHLAAALSARGIDLIPIRWDQEAQRFTHGDARDTPFGADADLGFAWASWIAPGRPGAPAWIFMPHPLEPDLLAAVTDAAHGFGLRVGALLRPLTPDDPAPAPLQAMYPALGGLDKVMAVSQELHDELYAFLLSSPAKVLAAEDRFQIIAPPNEVVGQERRRKAKREAQSIARCVVWVASERPDDLGPMFDAAAQAIKLSPIRLKFNFVCLLPQSETIADAALSVALATVPGAQWEQRPSAARVRDLIEAASFTAYVGAAGADAPEVTASLWRGVPCLVHKAVRVAAPFSGLGVVSADLRHAPSFAQELVKLTDAEWRGHLAAEAIARPVRTWEHYADAIAAALATDRLRDGLTAPDSGRQSNVFDRLPALRRRPVLSLCISTYNRAGWLGVNLKNIFRQIPNVRSDLEVLVVDNTSTDNTPEVVEPYLHRADFTYIRNPRNVGMLGNLAVTAQRARGDYIWILGDDDLTRDGVIEKVLNIIAQRPRISLIYMNYGYTSEPNPATVTDFDSFLNGFNILEPAGSDELATVKAIAAKCENFYTAIYSHVYRRDHGMRSYCQDTSERPFSTMLSCIPTSYYTLNYMADAPAYWIGEPSLVVNSNVSWQAYGTLLDLEQLPRAWDLAERVGCPPLEVDRRRANRLWLVELMWREIFEDDRAGNAAYFSAARVLMRLKHLDGFSKHIPAFRAIYTKAHEAGHPAARQDPSLLFRFSA